MLPSEILLEIAKNLEIPEIYEFSRCSSSLYNLVAPIKIKRELEFAEWKGFMLELQAILCGRVDILDYLLKAEYKFPYIDIICSRNPGEKISSVWGALTTSNIFFKTGKEKTLRNKIVKLEVAQWLWDNLSQNIMENLDHQNLVEFIGKNSIQIDYNDFIDITMKGNPDTTKFIIEHLEKAGKMEEIIKTNRVNPIINTEDEGSANILLKYFKLKENDVKLMLVKNKNIWVVNWLHEIGAFKNFNPVDVVISEKFHFITGLYEHRIEKYLTLKKLGYETTITDITQIPPEFVPYVELYSFAGEWDPSQFDD